MGIEIVTTADPVAWAGALARAGWHDFYHEAWYHALAERRGEGRAELIVATYDEQTVALPLLLRPIATDAESGDVALRDATSVYGYAGPVGTFATLDERTASTMSAAIAEYLRANAIVSVFTRLHVLANQDALLRGAGRVERSGTTVSIDLTLPPDRQFSDYRADNRNRIRRLEREGYTCRRHGPEDLDAFVSIYESTMKRLSATGYYMFDRDYYESMVDPSCGGLELWIVSDPEGAPAAAGLFSLRCGIAQYHLSGAGDRYRKQAPTTLMLDSVRRSAIERGATRFHLGGGLGGAEDSLFAFKSGFGTGRHDFRLWKWVVDAQRYDELEHQRMRRDPPPGAYFPTYRAP
jgi:hypothetical protein